jgi:hypothetical protein
MTGLYYWLGASRTDSSLPFSWNRGNAAMLQVGAGSASRLRGLFGGAAAS